MNNKHNGTNHHLTCDILAAEIDPCIAGLKIAGYAANTLCAKRAAIRRFVSWRQRLKPPGKEPDESEVTEFMANSSQLGPKHRSLASTALSAFLEHLRSRKLITTCAPKAPKTPSSVLEGRYANFLRDEKGLAERSLMVYLPLVPDLLGYLTKDHGNASVRRLNASILRTFLLERARDRSSERVRLLATPDRATATGRRDYAILLLLAKLGLRSSEVLSLELGDIRWRTGEILIRGKGNRKDLLPLPRDVGAAIARHLRLDRGVRPTQRIFLRTYAPRVPLTGPASIGHIVRRALVQAGVERPSRIAAHLFRHTLASRMLQQGANLRDISEVLRHRTPSTTEIYAKIDLRSLHEVVRPWPGGGEVRNEISSSPLDRIRRGSTRSWHTT